MDPRPPKRTTIPDAGHTDARRRKTLEMVEKKENDLVKKAVAAEVEEGRSCKWDHTYIHMSWLIVCIIQRNLPLKDWEQPVIFFKFSFTFTPRLWLQELFRETYYEAS
ncbi:uncharacterized protein LOC103502077 isoform X12 [Cucumis melo]|uniref:Uncharacterized protein LOC103502077 isoform X12 n=1 Tax=Cucumis melo TaxID=3656 RepID=A0ABM3KCD8_CUCME|nr:uncharacterized protein LOC103502077 isoform X12 [Cucumis melo]